MIKVVSDFLYRRWKCHFLAPQNGHFCQKCPSWDLKKRHFQCRYKKSETTFIIQTFPKNEDYSLWFHLLSLFRVGLDDFHFRALLALISEGKSDQNEKCNFAKEGVLRLKNWRKQTHLKTQFYIRKHVWQIKKMILDFSTSPSIYVWTSDKSLTFLCSGCPKKIIITKIEWCGAKFYREHDLGRLDQA